MNNVIIIGGGIAGLSAAQFLAEQNIAATLINADKIGQIKVCGEFFSPEAIPTLQLWQIPYILIDKAQFITPTKKYNVSFQKPCASVNRAQVELTLSSRARSKNVVVLENTKVTNLIPATNEFENHCIELSNGATLTAKKIIIATGRLPNIKMAQKKVKYVGIKAHFENIDINNQLHMHLSKGLYFGVTKIDDNLFNICCLAKKSIFDQFTCPNEFMQQQFNLFNNHLLNNAKQKTEWIVCSVLEFGKRTAPDYFNTYFIGDAAATIHPASGNGLSMGMTSGIMAAKHIIENSKQDFKKLYALRYDERLFYAKLMHKTFMNSMLANIALRATQAFPKLNNFFYAKTRDKF